MSQPPPCPACGSPRHEPHGKRLALYPYGPLAVFGLLLGSLHQASQPFQYTCLDCDREFLHRSVTAKVARILLWTIILVPIIGIVAIIGISLAGTAL